MERLSSVCVAGHHTFRCRSKVRELVTAKSVDDLRTLHTEGFFEQNVIIIGHGSNCLFVDDLDVAVLKVDIGGLDARSHGDDQVLITVGAGVAWDDVVEWSIENRLGGVECMVRIPGTCGAAPIQNIGAYGQELRDRFHSLQAFHRQLGTLVTLASGDCEFGYRDSVFKRDPSWVITSISITLIKNGYVPSIQYPSLSRALNASSLTSPTLRQIADHVIAIRSSKLPNPATHPNAGSFFKNPLLRGDQATAFLQTHPEASVFGVDGGTIKVSAGWLIEQTGWRGKMLGDVGVWPEHALVLYRTPTGRATGNDVIRLARSVKTAVYAQFGVQLQCEVRIHSCGQQDQKI